MNQSETIVAIATGMNQSGLGIIRISGDMALSIAKEVFRLHNHGRLDEIESHHAYYGYIYEESELIDEVLLLPMKAPKSFTKEDTVEIDCHGGILVMNKIVDTIIKHGARPAEPGEFTKRAFLNGRIDLSEAEAVIDVINSKTDYALKNSLKQLTGKLNKKIQTIREKILFEIAYIESALDDPEHISLDGYSIQLKEKLLILIKEVDGLASSFHDGKILTEGIQTVILGKPNVGKSSLLNVLVGEEKAIVTNIAGTTRDALEEQIRIDNLLLNIVDTAGIRNTEDIVEKIGVERAKKYAKDADLILVIIDSSSKLDESDYEIFNFIEDKRALILLNKSDLNQVVDINEIRMRTGHTIIQISAKDETGINEFKNEIKELFLTGSLNYNDEVFLTNMRQKNLIHETYISLKDVLHSIDDGMPEDFYSIDLVNAYDSLGRMIGEKIEDDVVNEIFSKFCMGK